MPRPPLPPGQWGQIKFTKNNNPPGWTARGLFRDQRGVRHDWKASAPTKVGAEAALRAKGELSYPQDNDRYAPSMTVAELFAGWLHEKKAEGSSSPTLSDYEQVWRLHLKSRFGSLRLFELTSSAIQQHLDSLSPSNSRRGRVVLNGMFTLAERFDAVTRNPVGATRSVRRTKKPTQSLTLEQIDEARRVFAEHDATKRGPKGGMRLSDFFDLMLGTGLRPGEALALQHLDIGLHQPTNRRLVRVTGTLRHRDGKGRGPLVKTLMPKTSSSKRTVLAPQFVTDLIAEIEERTGDVEPPTPLFTTSTGNWVQPNNVNRTIRKLRVGLSLDWMTSHTFRRTAATWVTERLGEEQASRLLGHADPAITRDYYIDRSVITPDLGDSLDDLGIRRRT